MKAQNRMQKGHFFPFAEKRKSTEIAWMKVNAEASYTQRKPCLAQGGHHFFQVLVLRTANIVPIIVISPGNTWCRMPVIQNNIVNALII